MRLDSENASLQHSIAARVRQAAHCQHALAAASLKARHQALKSTADAIHDNEPHILDSNRQDVANAREKGVSEPLIDRLELSQQRLRQMIQVLENVAKLPDPIGRIDGLKQLETGIRVGTMRVPLGVVALIYESRPGVTIEASALSIKSGNALILKGGSDARFSNEALISCVHEGLEQAGLPAQLVTSLHFDNYEDLNTLLSLERDIDVVIPRGGKGLIEAVMKHTHIPVLKHLDGICHLYVDHHAELDMAANLVFHSKTYRYGLCNALETLLVHQDIAARFLPMIASLLRPKGVELRCCNRSSALIESSVLATETDWRSEYLGPILAIRIVDDLDQALSHIAQYGSSHTDGIVTESLAHAQRFLREVDSSSVMVNAATTFADGAQYGLGGEMGVSTNKLHARGPVSLEGLTTYKYVVLGEGQWRV